MHYHVRKTGDRLYLIDMIHDSATLNSVELSENTIPKSIICAMAELTLQGQANVDEWIIPEELWWKYIPPSETEA